MRFSTRSKVSILLSLLTLLVLVGGFVATGIGRGQTSAAHAASPSSTAKTGHLTSTGTLSIAKMPTTSVAQTGKTRAMPFHTTHTKGGAASHVLEVTTSSGHSGCCS